LKAIARDGLLFCVDKPTIYLHFATPQVGAK